MSEPNVKSTSPLLPSQHERLAENWKSVVDDVAEACRREGRDASEVCIVGVTKYVDASMTAALHGLGCHHLGENRPQVLWKKAEVLSSAGHTPQWHQIGQLQTNKVRRLLRHRPIIHTLDRDKLVECVVEESGRACVTTPCMIEVNISGDENKSGLPIESTMMFVHENGLANRSTVQWTGLMGMSGRQSDNSDVRAQFASLRQLRDQLQTEFGLSLPMLSMGMSGDFQAAIAEGATHVRIGSRLFDGLMPN